AEKPAQLRRPDRQGVLVRPGARLLPRGPGDGRRGAIPARERGTCPGGPLMTAAVPPLSGNPFATRRVRPGAIPFLFPTGESVGQLLDRLRAAGWWGQVVGPHGSGKSTLVAALLPELCQAGREPLLLVHHRGERERLPP